MSRIQSHFESRTGLGLALVYQMAQGHGAKVLVLSRPESGVAVVLEILRAKAAKEESGQRVAVGEVARG